MILYHFLIILVPLAYMAELFSQRPKWLEFLPSKSKMLDTSGYAYCVFMLNYVYELMYPKDPQRFCSHFEFYAFLSMIIVSLLRTIESVIHLVQIHRQRRAQAQTLDRLQNVLVDLRRQLEILSSTLGQQSVGLSSEELKKIALKPYQLPPSIEVSGDKDSCGICCEEFIVDELLASLPKCNHTFHPKCAEEWLLQKNQCPMCRADVRKQFSGDCWW